MTTAGLLRETPVPAWHRFVIEAVKHLKRQAVAKPLSPASEPAYAIHGEKVRTTFHVPFDFSRRYTNPLAQLGPQPVQK